MTDVESVAPEIGDEREDLNGRKLVVMEVHVGARNGREVVGMLEWSPKGERGRERAQYSCPLTTYKRVWIDRLPAPAAEDMR